MAFTSSFLVKNVALGNSYLSVVRITPDAVNGAVDTGYDYIDAIVGWSPQSVTTNGSGLNVRIYPNEGSGATAVNGSIGISGCVSGDVFNVSILSR